MPLGINNQNLGKDILMDGWKLKNDVLILSNTFAGNGFDIEIDTMGDDKPIELYEITAMDFNRRHIGTYNTISEAILAARKMT